MLNAEGLVTRQQAQNMLGIGHRSMQRLISKRRLQPAWGRWLVRGGGGGASAPGG